MTDPIGEETLKRPVLTVYKRVAVRVVLETKSHLVGAHASIRNGMVVGIL